MLRIFDKGIKSSFYLLFLIVPLILFSKTSEIFEFNKMVFVYAISSIILFFWFGKMIVDKRFIFRRTILDLPLIIFLGSQVISTLLSIDVRTSIFGYYSRFNGGLLSSISYIFLYWAYVSNMDRLSTLKTFYMILVSSVIASVWGIFEHFGHSFSCFIFPEFRKFDVSCWVQDVKNRVYASFGQPNWLGAWLVAIIPLTWSLTLNSSIKEGINFSGYRFKNILAYNLLFITYYLQFSS